MEYNNYNYNWDNLINWMYLVMIIYIRIESNVEIEEQDNDMLWKMVQWLNQIGMDTFMTALIITLYNNNNINIRKYSRKKCNRIDKIKLNININSYNLQNKDI